MASLVRFTNGKGAYVVKTGSKAECEKVRADQMNSDDRAYKSIYIIADEVGFEAFRGDKGVVCSSGVWKS
jgi:hypothetical protein